MCGSLNLNLKIKMSRLEERSHVIDALRSPRSMSFQRELDENFIPNFNLLTLNSNHEDTKDKSDSFCESVDQGLSNENTLTRGLPSKCVNKLFKYQKVGVKWLLNCHEKLSGAVLADDMGLGKTIQVSCFLSYLFNLENIFSVLIVLPKSLVDNWSNELRKWANNVNVCIYSGTKVQRERAFEHVQNSSGVLICTYGLIQTSWDQLSIDMYNRPYTWDCVILDEAHKIRNPNKLSRCIRGINAKFRLVLTGTPIQNNLMEMWSLIDFITHGKLLGTRKSFQEYCAPITLSLLKGASSDQMMMGKDLLDKLIELISPYILRRTKKDQQMELECQTEIGNDLESNGNSIKSNWNLPKKSDVVLWIPMCTFQIAVYHEILNDNELKQNLIDMDCKKSQALVKLNILRLVANHPYLTSKWGFMENIFNKPMLEINKFYHQETSLKNYKNSSKLRLLGGMVKYMSSNGHKTLIFSQSRQMLDIVNEMLSSDLYNIKVLQLDGRTNTSSDREKIIQKFTNDSSISCLLLTTQVGGVGLNLIAADRVIILEPSWNPGVIYQAIDRAHRVGQRKNVIVYRLITCGTVEEKMYRNQVFKSSLMKQTVDKMKNPARFFSWHELRDLFSFENPYTSDTLLEVERKLGKFNPEEDEDYDAYNEIENFIKLGVVGAHEHNKIFSYRDSDDDVNYDLQNACSELNQHEEIIKQKTAKALGKITSEVNFTDYAILQKLKNPIPRLLNTKTISQPVQIEDTNPKVKSNEFENGLVLQTSYDDELSLEQYSICVASDDEKDPYRDQNSEISEKEKSSVCSASISSKQNNSHSQNQSIVDVDSCVKSISCECQKRLNRICGHINTFKCFCSHVDDQSKGAYENEIKNACELLANGNSSDAAKHLITAVNIQDSSIVVQTLLRFLLENEN